MPSLLAHLLRPGSALLDAWGTRPVQFKTLAKETDFDSIDDTLGEKLLGPPFISMFREQAPIEVERYTMEIQGASSLRPAFLLDRRRMLGELERGSSIKLNRMEMWNARVRRVADAIGAHFGYGVEAWGFFSTKREPMLPWHRDPSDNLAIQISGEKRWLIGGAMPRTDTAKQVHRLYGEIEDVCLAPGDVLYVPFGWAHQAEAVSTTSYHISLAVQTPTVEWVRRALLSTMAEDWEVDGMLAMRHLSLPDLAALFPPCMAGEVQRVVDRYSPDELRRRIREGMQNVGI